MELLGDLKNIVTLAGVFASLVVAWVTVKLTVKNLSEKLVAMNERWETSDKSQWHRINEIASLSEGMEIKVNIHSGLLRPDKLQEMHTDTATHRAEMKKDVEYLRRDVDDIKVRLNNGGK